MGRSRETQQKAAELQAEIDALGERLGVDKAIALARRKMHGLATAVEKPVIRALGCLASLLDEIGSENLE